VRLEPNPIEYIAESPLKGRLFTLSENIRLEADVIKKI